jgi:hypothetical protein
MELETPEKPSIKFDPRIKYGIIVVLILVAVIPSVYFYTQYHSAQKRLSDPTAFAQEEAKKYTAMVARLMTLPTDEEPTVATVNDKEKLKNQPFFTNAENGDKVLIYTNAKKAILYRPSINKIIDVAPVNIGANATGSAQLAGAESTVTPAALPAYKFILLNGTNVVGLTKKYETELKSIIKNAEVADRDNAKKATYEDTILIDSTGTKANEAAEIAEMLGIEISDLPEGEATPGGDFVIILGTDRK